MPWIRLANGDYERVSEWRQTCVEMVEMRRALGLPGRVFPLVALVDHRCFIGQVPSLMRGLRRETGSLYFSLSLRVCVCEVAERNKSNRTSKLVARFLAQHRHSPISVD
ncbi:hypothetical protein LZ32DRAFT_280561 [Colletotrichum eremochloae]|nr:hypothetical protein LZ32DRAFT_280561 [Colletotrichum eremochloae]